MTREWGTRPIMSESQPTAAGPGHAPENPTVAFERKDVNPKGIMWFLVGLAVLIVIVLFVVFGLFVHYSAVEARQKRSDFPVAEAIRREAREADPAGLLPPAPRLEGVVTLPAAESAGRVFPPAAHEQHDVGRIHPGAAQVLYDVQEKELDSWQWADADHKAARIPVAEAMSRLLDKPGDRLKARAGSKRPDPDGPRQRPRTDSGRSSEGGPK
jgi:hypothetical protein